MASIVIRKIISLIDPDLVVDFHRLDAVARTSLAFIISNFSSSRTLML